VVCSDSPQLDERSGCEHRKLEDSQRTQFENTLSGVKMPEVAGFATVWSDLSNPETVKAEIAIAFKEIEDPTPEQMEALKD